MITVIVGGLGLIGSKIANHLIAEGHKVRILDLHLKPEKVAKVPGAEVCFASVEFPEDLIRLFDGADEVYHLAGVLGTSELEKQIPEAVKVNIVGAVNVFESAVKAGVGRVFYPSKPNVWRNVYTITKEASEELAGIYNAQGKIKITSLRLFNAYGPGQSLIPIRKIVPLFALQALHDKPIQIWGNGEQTVDLVYTDDIAATAVEATHKGLTGVYDYGRGVGLSVNYVAKAINEIADNPNGVQHLPMRAGETPNTKLAANIAPLEAALGHKLQFTDFLDSLAGTVWSYHDLPKEYLRTVLEYYKIV